MRVVELGLEHEIALAEFRQAFKDAGESSIPALFLDEAKSHAEVVAEAAAWSRGEVPEGFVPNTTLFAEAEGELWGVVSLRHHLIEVLEVYGGHVGYSVRPDRRRRGVATALLAAARQRFVEMGVSSLVLTCDPSNVGSIRVITANGGVLRDRYFYEPRQREVLRWDVPT